jgi:hypothetical protein
LENRLQAILLRKLLTHEDGSAAIRTPEMTYFARLYVWALRRHSTVYYDMYSRSEIVALTA